MTSGNENAVAASNQTKKTLFGDRWIGRREAGIWRELVFLARNRERGRSALVRAASQVHGSKLSMAVSLGHRK